MRTALLVLALAACDPLAGRDYVGEPLITLAGTFAPTSAAPSDPVGGVALMWQDPDGAGGPGKAATSVPVAMEFPASFSIAVPTPPPDGVALVFGDGSAVAEAYIFVVGDVGEAHPTRLFGADRAHALIYAPSDIADGSAAAAYLGGAVSAGYHVRRYTSADAPPPAQSEPVTRCMKKDPADACKVRRAYQLAATSDDEPLRIVLWPP